ncbi:hypothetical protein ZWY2020_000111 [Hordeum vulgare]|nr:hypothetical protein ZWY2020_000111 [Hordeum vulgare]
MERHGGWGGESACVRRSMASRCASAHVHVWAVGGARGTGSAGGARGRVDLPEHGASSIHLQRVLQFSGLTCGGDALWCPGSATTPRGAEG